MSRLRVFSHHRANARLAASQPFGYLGSVISSGSRDQDHSFNLLSLTCTSILGTFRALFVLREVVAKQRRALIVTRMGQVCLRRRNLGGVIVREFPRSCEWDHLDGSLQCRPRAAD